MIQGVSLTDAYQTLQTFLGGYFVNYFNRFGLQWQVYIQAEEIIGRTSITSASFMSPIRAVMPCR